MPKRNPPFWADHVGSLLCPPGLLQARRFFRPVRYLQNNYGFSSTVHGQEITEAEQGAKLELVVNIAREIWGIF